MSSNSSSTITKGILAGAYSFLGGFFLPICPPAGAAMIAGGVALGASAAKDIADSQKNNFTKEILNIIP